MHRRYVGQRLVSRLTEFANLCFAGEVSTAVDPTSLQRGFALCVDKEGWRHQTDSGGMYITTASGKRQRRSLVPETMAAKLAPLIQLGFGVKQGTVTAASSRHTSVLARLATGTSFVEAGVCESIQYYQ